MQSSLVLIAALLFAGGLLLDTQLAGAGLAGIAARLAAHSPAADRR